MEAEEEVFYYFHILPLMVSVALSAAFTLAGFSVRQFTGEDIGRYLQYMLPIGEIYIIGSSIVLMFIITIYI